MLHDSSGFTILTADVGGATTKSSLIKSDDTGYTLLGTARAPTTWNTEGGQVMVGILDSLRILEQKTGRPLISDGRPILDGDADRGADALMVTSSAAGGMRLLCLGLVRMMTAESAERAALGAGATLSAVVAADDGRTLTERLAVIRDSDADMVLMAGGTDDGTVEHVVALAEYLAAARPKPRLGEGVAMPIIFAGNVLAREPVLAMLESIGNVHIVENLRPSLDKEVLEPVRELIADLYLEHVAQRTPGFSDLLYWTGGVLEPTPAAAGKALRSMADTFGVNVLGVDMGASTADVFSVIDGAYNRSVSTEVGVGVSADGILERVGVDAIAQWLHYPVEERDLENWIMNRTLRPQTVPTEIEELHLFHALARESLKLAYREHRDLVVGLKGVKQYRTFDDTFEQTKTGLPLIHSSALDVIIGTGSILSATPSPAEAAMILLDGIQPAGISRFYVDKHGLMPQVGALMDHAPEVQEVFFHRWLLPLGTVVAPTGEAWGRHGSPVAEMYLTDESGRRQFRILRVGELDVVPLGTSEAVRIEIIPRRNYDLGDGPGTRVSADVKGGEIGLIIDVRGRPLIPPKSDAARFAALGKWRAAMGLSREGEAMFHERVD